MVSGHSGKPRELPVTNEWIEEQDKRWRQFYLAAGGKDIWHGFSCENFNFKSAQPPTCPEDCKLCCDQFVPTRSRQQSDQYPVAMHSDAKATEVIQTLIHTIENNYAYIKAKIDSHGNGIVNRWLKKTQAKREQLLLAAMPTLPTQKHSDMKLIFEAITLMSDFRNGRLHRDVLKRRRHHEDTHLLSSLSTTSLSEDPMRMLALMHYRSQAKAGDWMHFDREAIQHQFHSGLLQTAYNPHCVVAYGEAFGDLVPWEKNASHRWDIIGYPICRHLLRVQEKVSTMLRGTLDGILNPSIQDATKGRDTWDCLVHASFKSESRFIPKAAYYNNLFAAPPKFDLGHIVRVMRVRHEAAFDDAFTARTDPVYLRRLLQKVRNSTAYTRVDDQLKKFMIFEAPIYDILRFNAWNCFRHLARVLEETMKGKKLAQKPGSPLPRDYEKALMNLEAALRCRFAEQAGTVSLHVANSPSFAHHFKDRRQITIPKVAFDEDPLFWVIIELAAQNIDTNQTASWLFSFLDEHLSKASKKEKARIDQALYDHLADMAAVNEILSMIKYHKSYACLPKDRKLCERVYADDRLNSPFYVLDQHLYHCFNYEEIHDALQQFMSLPLPVKGSSPMKLQQHKDLFEQFLKYWYSIRRGLVKRMRQLEVSDGMQYQQLRLFDDYSGFVKYFFNEERKAIKRDIEAKEKSTTPPEHNDNFLPSQAKTTENLRSEAIAKSLEQKIKIKSRPDIPLEERLANAVEDLNLQDTTETASPTVRIEVRARSIELFTNMFSTSEGSQGRTRWDDFVGAMVDAGCSATHGGGSAVTFENERNKQGSIVIHRPHPDSSIDPVMLKAFGKRLTRRMGWDENTFVERAREETEEDA